MSPFLGAESDEDHRNSGDETDAGAVSRRKGAERDMEAMVDMTCVGQEQIAKWLHAVASSRDAVVLTATQHLEAAHNIPQFPLLLLTLSAGRRRPSGSHLLHAHL